MRAVGQNLQFWLDRRMQLGQRGVGGRGTVGRDAGIVLAVDEQQRKISEIRQACFDLVVTLARAHQRNDGGEALRPQSGEVERAGSSVAEAGQVNSIAVDVVALEDVVQDGVEAARDLRLPPVSGGLGIEHEVIGFRDDVLGGVHAIDGEPGAAAQVDQQRRRPILAVGERNAQQVRDLATSSLAARATSSTVPNFAGGWRRGKRAAAFVRAMRWSRKVRS